MYFKSENTLQSGHSITALDNRIYGYVSYSPFQKILTHEESYHSLHLPAK